MIRNMLTAGVAAAALTIAAPAIAGPGGGRGGDHGGMGRGGGAGAAQSGGRLGGLDNLGTRTNVDIKHGAGGRIGADARISGQMNENDNDQGENEQGDNASRINLHATNESHDQGEGFFHGSPNGIGHANQHSLLAQGAVPGALFPGLTSGLTVQSSGGATLGTISNVITSKNGLVAGVVVTTSTGQKITVPASALSVANGTVTVSTAEAFEGHAVPGSLLPGLTTGLAVSTDAGASLGTVSQVVTDSHGNITGVIVTDASGKSIQLPASAVSVSGNTVTVNAAEAFEFQGVPSSLLTGLTTGLSVNTAAGSSFGTVSQVNTGANGNITSVVITAANGQKFVVPASTLTISGNVVTVANTAEAFERAGVPSAFLPDLATGLTVNSSTGASLGTVSQVIMGANGTIAGVMVTTATGQTFVLPASDLSMNGNIVTVANIGF